METKQFLKQNTVMEALIDRWYAWPHLVSPITAALNIKRRHLNIMESYMKNPKVHAAAVKKPEMLGGPFINYKEERVNEIKDLYDQTIFKRANLLKLTEAIDELHFLLQNDAKGYSLDPLYEKIPQILKGYVELYYDLNNQPNFRIFEYLLYESEFYDESMQSISLQLIDADDSRSFVLSTPRLESEGVLFLDIPFKSNLIDKLFKMKKTPGNVNEMIVEMGIPKEKEALFKSLFTDKQPDTYNKYDGPGIRTRYFGHASILIETKEVSILVDPVISYEGYETQINRFTINDLPEEIDYVIITHNHQDHILLETVLQLRHAIKNIIVPSSSKGNLQDPDLKIMLNKLGFKNVIQLDVMETVELDRCKITGLPFLGEHCDLDIRTKLCYHVDLHNELKIILAADSCNIEPEVYKKVFSIIGEIDILFLGMECDGAPLFWLYGPLMYEKLDRDKDFSRRLAGSDYNQGISLIDIFNPKKVFVYAMGLEPWLEFISSLRYTNESRPIVESNKLINECTNRGLIAERLFGEKTIEL